MARLNFISWGLIMVLILTIIGLLDASRTMGTSGFLGTTGEEDYVNNLVTGNVTSLTEYQSSIDNVTKNVTEGKETIANQITDNILFHDAGFSFVGFIKKVPALLDFAVRGTTTIYRETQTNGTPLIGKLLILLMLLPLNIISIYVLWKFMFTSSRID